MRAEERSELKQRWRLRKRAQKPSIFVFGAVNYRTVCLCCVSLWERERIEEDERRVKREWHCYCCSVVLVRYSMHCILLCLIASYHSFLLCRCYVSSIPKHAKTPHISSIFPSLHVRTHTSSYMLCCYNLFLPHSILYKDYMAH